MNEEGFRKFYWGFFFIMIDFRIQGIDILPDIIGYILFASGFAILAGNSEYFNKASKLNIPMIILSIFAIYKQPNQGEQGPGINIQWGHLGFLSVLIGIAATILGLLVVYNLFLGIKDMGIRQEKHDIYEEAGKRWNQYLMLQVAAIFTFVLIFIPALGLLYVIGLLIASIILTLAIMGFMKRCGEKVE